MGKKMFTILRWKFFVYYLNEHPIYVKTDKQEN